VPGVAFGFGSSSPADLSSASPDAFGEEGGSALSPDGDPPGPAFPADPVPAQGGFEDPVPGAAAEWPGTARGMVSPPVDSIPPGWAFGMSGDGAAVSG
jgi:hypothetical protein